MVANVTSFGRSGVYDWLIQRVSAVAVGLYVFILAGYLITHPGLGYEQWHAFMSCGAMRIASTLALLATLAHAWIGLWVITTDYVTNALVRVACQSACGLAAAIYLVWGVQILWGL
ncbi:MAG: succinate dehydrogenase, hydrophobic membrane anchor protein [Gammaproteobacteria bacterium]|nr:succinate dehydrogenase, hydrophobic membrane anchor protein [Gammaproteobacteria bacterium]